MKQQIMQPVDSGLPIKKPRIQKDAVIKSFIDNNDVFADVANYVLFGGERVIRKDHLESVHPVSLNYREDSVSWLARDSSKIWKKEEMIICMIGCENQMAIDPNMLFRTLMYDAASYLSQIRKGYCVKYPVLTIVLYFGSKRWDEVKTLYETLHVPEHLKPFVNDWKMTLVDVLRISGKDSDLFVSDFGPVLKCLKNKDDPDYKGDMKELLHKGEVIDIMNAFGVTAVSEEAKENMTERPLTMRRILTEEERKTIRAEAKAEGKAEVVQSLMNKLGFSVAEAMDFLDTSEEEKKVIAEIIHLQN